MSHLNTTYTELTAGGGTVNIDVQGSSAKTILYSSGAVTLTSNWTIQPTNTPTDLKGMESIIEYEANLDFNGNTLTIYGTVVPASLQAVKFTAHCLYDGSAWKVKFKPDFAGSEFIATDKLEDGAVTTAKIAATAVDSSKLASASVTASKIDTGAVEVAKLETKLKKEVLVVPVSFETGEQTTTKILFNHAATIDSCYFTVTKAIAATDNAGVSFNIMGVAMTPASTVITASTAIGTVGTVTFTGTNNIASGNTLEITTSKVTPGGKLTLTFNLTRT